MTASVATAESFTWGLGDAHGDESPTKRRRTATQRYVEQSEQQPKDSTPTAGLTRRNRTKTRPSSDAFTQPPPKESPAKDSLQPSISTVAALAKDFNLMEALVLSPNEMEAQGHRKSPLLPAVYVAKSPPPPSLAQGASWGPEEKTFRPILCAKEDLQQRSVRIAIPPHPGSRK